METEISTKVSFDLAYVTWPKDMTFQDIALIVLVNNWQGMRNIYAKFRDNILTGSWVMTKNCEIRTENLTAIFHVFVQFRFRHVSWWLDFSRFSINFFRQYMQRSEEQLCQILWQYLHWFLSDEKIERGRKSTPPLLGVRGLIGCNGELS